jgi:hypothetical protein
MVPSVLSDTGDLHKSSPAEKIHDIYQPKLKFDLSDVITINKSILILYQALFD